MAEKRTSELEAISMRLCKYRTIQARRKAGRINSALRLHPARHHAQGSQRAARSEFLSPHLPGSLEASPTAGLGSGEGLAVGMVWSCVRRGLLPMHTARREIRSPFLLPERDSSTGLEGENRSPGPFPEPPAFPHPGAAGPGQQASRGGFVSAQQT